MKYCISCGAVNSDSAHVCSRCGKAFIMTKGLETEGENKIITYNKQNKNKGKKNHGVKWLIFIFVVMAGVLLYNYIIYDIEREQRNTGSFANMDDRIKQWRETKGVYELKTGSLEINGEVITSISYYPEFEGGLKGVKLNDFEATKSMGAVFWECSGETLDFEIDNDFIMTVSKKIV